MKKHLILLAIIALMSGCDDFLDRPQLTQMDDDSYWTTENNLRLFANGFYSNYFVGYNSGFGVDYAPLRGYTFNDDLTSSGKQSNFEIQAPATRVPSPPMESASWLSEYAGPRWNFAWVRKSNVFIERIEEMKGTYLKDEPYNHWSAVARFFRGYEYSRLVSVFGDVPYYDREMFDTDLDELYKDRDSRTFVMDQVYNDFAYVLANMRQSDGTQYLNRYIAAGFISRFMLFEGTWQKYHLGDNAKATQYLQLAVDAANVVIQSGKWSFASDFRSLFGSESLSGNKEVLMYRQYDATVVMHAIASYSNITESQVPAANLDLVKSFIAKDGLPYQLSAVPNASEFNLANLIVTRDPRFEATFWDVPRSQSATLLYADKFIDRAGPTFAGGTYPPQYGSSTNTNDAPVMRLAEVVLNMIEAKAELETLGGTAVSQADLDASINAIRNRPLDAAATGKGVAKTAPLLLAAIPNDPDRDPDVPALIWEIRRERRMEFVLEHTRLMDIKRWKKIEYMNGATNPDLLLGPWVDFPAEFTSFLVPAKVNKLKVMKLDNTVVTYDGTNAAAMIGFYIPENVSNRDPFTDRVYNSPVGNNEISQYAEKGYTLTQTPGW